jgi:hypothetical protein
LEAAEKRFTVIKGVAPLMILAGGGFTLVAGGFSALLSCWRKHVSKEEDTRDASAYPQ